MTDLAQLRSRIAALEGRPLLASASGRLASRPGEGAEQVPGHLAPLGVPAIDTHLPWGGLPAGCLHEIRPAGRSEAPASAFAAFCLGRFAKARRGPLLWLSQDEHLYPPGLAGLGLPVERLLLVRPPRQSELLWALEEALRCKAVGAVAAELAGLDLKAVRRLSLASRDSGVPALLLTRGPAVNGTLTRWEVAASPGISGVGVGPQRWRLTLARCRGLAAAAEERDMTWILEAKDAAHGIDLVALSQHGPARQIERANSQQHWGRQRDAG